MNALKGTLPVFKRELAGYFATPVAYVFIVIFLLLTGIFTWQLGRFFEAGQASLRGFFDWHPWLYLFLIPAVSMRLWAEERRGGTLELLLTLPISLPGAVVGKFLAAWSFTAVALALTFPMWITVNFLGDPDNGVVLAQYIGSLLMAGGFLAIGQCMSATSKSQVIAFVISVVVCFIFLLIGFEPVLVFFRSWTPDYITEALASFSFITRFDSISKGVIDIRDFVYFITLIAAFLTINTILIEAKKS